MGLPLLSMKLKPYVYEVKVERGSNILYSLQTEELPTKSFVVL